MKKRQIYSKIRVRENQRGAKSESARKLKARILRAANFNRNKVGKKSFSNIYKGYQILKAKMAHVFNSIENPIRLTIGPNSERIN